MSKLRVLSARGDTVLEWDERKLHTGDPEALAAVREAERIFEEQRARGATAFKVEPDRVELLDAHTASYQPMGGEHKRYSDGDRTCTA